LLLVQPFDSPIS